jgi:hypothetical protein
MEYIWELAQKPSLKYDDVSFNRKEHRVLEQRQSSRTEADHAPTFVEASFEDHQLTTRRFHEISTACWWPPELG